MEESANILNDKEYVSLINKLSSSIYQFALATKGNMQTIQNNFDIMEDELKLNEYIKSFLILSKSNEKNLINFFSDAKMTFKNLRAVRKEYLEKVSNYINHIISENIGKKKIIKNNSSKNIRKFGNSTPGKNTQFLDLLINLANFSDIIGLYSEQDKERYINLLNIILNEFQNNGQYLDIQNFQNNNLDNTYTTINNNNLEQKYENKIKNYEKYISKLKFYISNLEKKIEILSRNNNIVNYNEGINHMIDNSLNLRINDNNLSYNMTKLKQELKKERYDSAQKDRKIKELKDQNNILFKKYKENENEKLKKESQLLSLSEEVQLYKCKFNNENRKNNENKDIINNLKRENILINNYNSTINNNNLNNLNNNENLDVLTKEKTALLKENKKIKEENKEKEQKYTIL